MKRASKSGSSKSGSVGYGRPPVHTRFKPGRSGNPTGRPGGKRSVGIGKDPGALIWKIVKEKLRLREGERELSVSKLEGVLRSTVAKALKGDVRALTMILNLLSENCEFETNSQPTRKIEVSFVQPVIDPDDID
jgi:hypothetical protein